MRYPYVFERHNAKKIAFFTLTGKICFVYYHFFRIFTSNVTKRHSIGLRWAKVVS